MLSFCPVYSVCLVFVQCLYVNLMLEHMAVPLFMLLMFSPGPASLFPVTPPLV